MLFNSIDFAIFMPIVFLIYWALGYCRGRIFSTPMIQNLFLLAASYFFYAWWDWRFLSLILVCSFTNYGAGLLLMKNENARARKTILTLCCLVCFGILGVFKYYDFFATQLISIFTPPPPITI
jgi:D-alanyl-lipoteichoic acid acyltransferase DltB (MBOAT superfamily)